MGTTTVEGLQTRFFLIQNICMLQRNFSFPICFAKDFYAEKELFFSIFVFAIYHWRLPLYVAVEALLIHFILFCFFVLFSPKKIDAIAVIQHRVHVPRLALFSSSTTVS